MGGRGEGIPKGRGVGRGRGRAQNQLGQVAENRVVLIRYSIAHGFEITSLLQGKYGG